jgi:hypothetical protein
MPAGARADDSASGDQLKINFTPYVWLPTLNGTFRYNYSDLRGGQFAKDVGQTFDATVGPNGYLSKINFALMGTVTVRKGRWGLLADGLNANVSSSGARVANFTGPGGHVGTTLGVNAQTQVVSTLFTVAPTYNVYQNHGTSVNVLAGGQFMWLSNNAQAQATGEVSLGNLSVTRTVSVGVSKSASFGNVIFGSDGDIGLSKHWSIPYYVDVGTGTPSFTWEGFLAAKYGNASLGWRYLQFNAGGDTSLLQRLSLGGPYFGYTLRL